MKVDFSTRLRDVLGAQTASKMAERLGLHTAGDLLEHYPSRYFHRGERTELDELVIDEQVTVMAQVKAAVTKPLKKRAKNGRELKLLEVTVADARGRSLTLAFFNQPWRTKELQIGRWGLFAGKVSAFRGRLQLQSPEARMFDAPDEESAEGFAGGVIPVYPSAEGLPTWKIAQSAGIVLDTVTAPSDPLPGELRRRLGLAGYSEALEKIHRPASSADLARARKRLKWQEAFVIETALVQRKNADDSKATARPPEPGGLLEKFDRNLPFALTAGQEEVGGDIAAALASERPMHRLLQGDVGAGKTVVALRAMLQVAESGGQAALLAPTEVLASQHFRSLSDMLELAFDPGEVPIELVTGSAKAAARRASLTAVASGAAPIVVGTHALLFDEVAFRDLGLVVVDEQHRFGVEQRDALRAKSERPPHTLVMTATPIPRTVAMTVYGDLDVSRLTDLPAGRSPIATHVVPAGDERWTGRMWERFREEARAGRQGYVVCPRVGPDPGDAEAPDDAADEDDSMPSVRDTFTELSEGPLSGLRVAPLHGRMDPDEKNRTMSAFERGEIDVLVATTVIEVGVNVPNATAMAVLGAERFGISQLHQLRGRVGRGRQQGLCLLVTGARPGTRTRERLDAVASSTDGFHLAELDLEQRREGDILGEAQSGSKSHVRLLSLLHDTDIIEAAREEAERLLAADPGLDSQPVLASLVGGLAEDRGDYLQKG
ncbi:ATP-dependent DNA helicase RecG [Salininema proteolyticum]|uniref:Probable DNA 3'-5' helicase RecG n=1 Tax=Salininema proteolyticum TaxID=1607685 RepID=A0ABV8TZ00_9ACTN